MGSYSNDSLNAPDAIAEAIAGWKETGFAHVFEQVNANLTGEMMNKVTGATLEDVTTRSGLEPFGFRLSTSMPSLIAWMEGSPRKGYWVFPKKPGGLLSWIDKATGERRFSKGHYINPWRFKPIRPVMREPVDKSKPYLIGLAEAEFTKALRRLFPDVQTGVKANGGQ